MASKSTTKLKKTKSRELIDTNIKSVANINLAKNKANSSANDATSNTVEPLDQNNNLANSNVLKNVADDPNASNNKVKNVDNDASNVKQQNQNQNEALDPNANVNSNAKVNDANDPNANNANAAKKKPKWVKDKRGIRVKEAELKKLNEQWDKYQKSMTEQLANGWDDIKLTDKNYFPDIDWDDFAKTAKTEYKKMDVDKYAKLYGPAVKNKDLVLVSEPHNDKTSGFAIARKIIEDQPPGILMLEAPMALNQSPDIVKALGYWGKHNGGNTMYGALAKEAVDKGWTVVPIDGTDPNEDKVVFDLMKDAQMPDKLMRKNVDSEPGMGSKVRQAYIGRNIHGIVKDNPNKGGVVLIGNVHIKSHRMPDISPMISETASNNAPNITNLWPLKENKVNKKGMRFFMVEVDTGDDNMRDEVEYDPK